MKQKAWGVIILVGVILFAGAYMFFNNSKPKEVNITGLLGGEKIGMITNPEFKKYVKKEYGLTMDHRKAGSLQMVEGNTEGQDYLFPSSQLALELFKKNGNSSEVDDIVFNTPIVLYSRKVVVDALIKEGIVSVREGTHYVNMEKLAQTIASEKSWADIGLPQLYGNVLVDTTDPNKSNSGNMFLGLLANALNGNQVVDSTNIENIKPQLQKIYQLIGYMQSSSSDMFNQFLKQGVGSYPIIAGYENQLLEFSKQEPEVFNQVKGDVRILYPEPTVWSSHVYIALTPEGKAALQALKDKEVQKMAWTQHGFRTVVAGATTGDEFQIDGLAKDVTKVMRMPDIETMLILMETVQ